MSFEKLLEELDVMAKAMGDEDDNQDDENIQAAAGNGGNADAGDDAAGNHAEPDGDENEDGMEPMGKSFAFTLDDGQVVEAIDGTELVKSLIGRMDSTDTMMTKALTQTLDLVKSQGEMIKALRGEIKKLAGEGRGRKAVVTVAEKVPAGQQMTTSEQPSLTPQEFFAKANDAFGTGRITGQELTVIDVSLRSGMAVDQGLVAKVVG